MSSFGSPSPFFIAGKKAFAVDGSLRFSRSGDPKLVRTATSTSNTFTFSTWLKRASFSTFQYFFSVGGTGLLFNTDNGIRVYSASGSNTSTAKFRDPNAWYHVVLSMNSGSATVYVNNIAHLTSVAGFSLSTSTNYLRVGFLSGSAGEFNFDGYLAETHLIDGSALTPSSFAETDATTGQWIPKKYVGGYGTSGFLLNYSDNSSASALGTDSSGNNNNFTPSNLVTGDFVKDSPTNNFATLNVLSKSSGVTTQEGNLYAQGSSAWRNIVANFHMSSGKWYWEIYIKQVGTAIYGIMPATRGNGRQDFYADIYTGTYSDEWGYRNNGYLYNSASANTSWGDSYTTGDILSFALDMDNGTLDIKKNNSATGSQITGISTSKEYRAAFTYYTSGTQSNINFGQDSTFAGQKTAQGNTDGSGQGDFYYAPPSGYKALCSANLPNPTIKLPNNHFNTITWSGNNTSGRTLTGVGFSPDWTWLKCRSTATNHHLYDIVRGANKILHSDSTDAEDSNDQYGYLSAFTSDGFTLTNGSNASYPAGSVNMTGRTYVGWNWNAGDTDGKTYTVKVVSDSGNKYRFDDFGTSAVTLELAEGGTYIFDQSDSSNAGHPLRFYTAADKTGGEYTTGVTTAGTAGSSGAYTQIVVAASAPTLFYQCSVHAGMGGQANTNTTLGSSNFDGTIQSTVKTNTTAGFSIVTYTGTGADGTVGHGLGVIPDFVVVKNRDSSEHWSVKHKNLTSGYNVKLNLTEAEGQSTGSTNGIIADLSSSNNFSLTRTGNTGNYDNVNINGDKHVAYCFSGVSSYSKFGSYVGNGSTDGVFVHLGFRPALVITKQINGAGSWFIFDNKRSGYNETDPYLMANVTNAEASDLGWDLLSNGFKLRNSYAACNGSGNTFIYLAFAESPFKNARAR